MDIVVLKQISAIIIGVLGCILAIIGLAQRTNKVDTPRGKENKHFIRRIILVTCVIVIVAFVGLSTYIELINKDLITADLVITVAQPRAINVGGTEQDRFVVNADYKVVSYATKFVIDATVKLTNTKTNQRFEYHPVSEDGSFTIANFNSGEYRVQIYSGADNMYDEIVIFSRANILHSRDKDTWNFTAFLFDDFWENAVEFSANVKDKPYDKDYPIFTLYEAESNRYEIFKSDIDQLSGNLAGRFYGYPGIYKLDNAITNSQMNSVVIDVEPK